MVFTDMHVKNTLENIKKRCLLLLVIVLYCGFAWIAYDLSIHSIVDLVESGNVVYFIWPCFFGILFVPAICYFIFVFPYVFFTKNLQAPKLLAKGITLAYHYFGMAFIIGNILSLIVIFYPLGTNYISCERSGPFSGTYYTRTEEICEQVKYLQKTRARKDIKKLKDRLDSESPR